MCGGCKTCLHDQGHLCSDPGCERCTRTRINLKTTAAVARMEFRDAIGEARDALENTLKLYRAERPHEAVSMLRAGGDVASAMEALYEAAEAFVKASHAAREANEC
jgi:hypothetical protein